MKKNALVQLILIYLGISSLYLAAYSVIQDAYLIIFDSKGYQTNFIVEYLVSYSLVGLFGVIIIANSGGISTFIANRSGLDDSLTIYTKPQQLLSILIVITAMAHLLNYLPTVTSNLIALFTDNIPKVQPDLPDGQRGAGWQLSFLHILFPCLMIIFARNLTRYFAKNIMLDDEDIVAHNDTVELEATGEADDEAPPNSQL